jgi:nucleotide-binding universal stress UspA family protein
MKTILVPVDGSDSALRAVKAAMQEAAESGQADIHLVTVHPPIVSGNVKRFFSADAINDFYQDEGRNALLSAKALLDEAGVAYHEKIEIGPIAQTIANYAKKNNCTQIIMGTRGLGSVGGLVLGSITIKVLSLVDIPVTLVK